MTAIVIIAAVAENGVIGNAGEMPWRLRSDLSRFRALTMSKPVLMGRKTFLSIGKALSGRTNVVVSRDRAFTAPAIVAAPDLDRALEVARADALRLGIDEIMVIGGAEIYAALMPQATRLELTFVHAAPEGDAIFPAIDPAAWQETARQDHPAGPQDTAPFSYCTFERFRPA